ncbi:MAG: phosphoadenylyl-sulfate reductase [Burkholderiales bacterium]
MSLDDRIRDASDRLIEAVGAHPRAAFSSSFGAEDMVVLDLISGLGLEVDVFTLDTGRLHGETLELIDRARDRYAIPVRILFPQADAVETFTTRHGVNAFYQSVELRKQCCEIRKLEPLRRALAGKALWITGLRREQSVTRSDVPFLQEDPTYGLVKANPLADWTSVDVNAYIQRHDVPVNALHARGFPSIGCAPCTRAIQPGEDERAGRWWWEQPESRECGLHVGPDGRLVRAKAATGTA